MSPFGKYDKPVPFNVGDWVLTSTGQRLQIQRIDRHVYPICAGYTRFKPEQITKIINDTR